MAAQTGPQDEQSKLISAIHQTLEQTLPPEQTRPGVRMDSDLDSELGMDSLTRAELLVTVEQTFGVQLPDQVLGDADTPQDILQAVMVAQGHQSASPSRAAASDAEPDKSQQADRKRFDVPEFETFQEILQWHAREHPRRTYLQWIKGYDDIDPLSYGDLHQGSLRIARGLFQHDVEQRDTVALMLPTGHDYFYCFFGCLYANTIPVPMYPPMRASVIEEHLRRQSTVLNNARVKVLITTTEVKKLAALLKGLVPSLEHVVTVEDLWGEPLQRPATGAHANDIAFLQYTSGSTGNPKGVEISHANLLENIAAARDVVEATQDDVIVSWLPLYHDMGLIGTCLSSLRYGLHFVVMSPLLFLTKPRHWLWAIDHFGGTLSPAPNFGYELCLRRLRDEDMEGLDLSSWRLAFNGAEPVSPDTVQRLSERFRRWGLRPEAMAPVYGLAENTVALTFPDQPREPIIDTIDRDRFQQSGEAVPVAAETRSALRFVSCGKAVPRHRIRIIDSTGAVLPERREGDLQFTGPSATRGYYHNPEQNAELFDGDWLNTGDRGYLAHDELYLSGRSKDLIIRAGRNLYPSEIEDALGQLEHVRSGCVAAFATSIGDQAGEKLVVVAETRARDRTTRARIKTEIARIARAQLGIDVDDVVVARPHTVPKTSSGKLQRNDCRLRYERGELEQKALPVWRQLARLALGTWRNQVQRAGRALTRGVYAGWCWTASSVVGGVLIVLLNAVPSMAGRWALAHYSARLLARLTGTRLLLEGAEHLRELPQDCVLVANHASYLDAPLLTALVPMPVSFVAKIELFRSRVLRHLMTLLHVEAIDRSSEQSSVRAARRLAERARGRKLLFFVEGGIDPAPGIRPFQMGAFMTAAVNGEPVVPLAIQGTRHKLPAGRWNPRPGPLTLLIGEPVEPDGDDWHSAVTLRDHCRQQIISMSGEPDRLQR